MKFFKVIFYLVVLAAWPSIAAASELVANDLKQKFGDLSQMHIVEIGGGEEPCKVLAESGGFAGYTIVDSPDHLAHAKKYLSQCNIENVHYVELKNLSQLAVCDLVVSHRAFSEKDLTTFEQIIRRAKNGYLVMDGSSCMDELVRMLYEHRHRGVVETHRDHFVMTWKERGAKKQESRVEHKGVQGNGITYSLHKGRLGDNLCAYLHAKWLAYKCHLPLYYRSFHYSKLFSFADEHQPLKKHHKKFKARIKTADESEINSKQNSSLFVVPFFPENTEHIFDHEGRHLTWVPSFQVDWEDPEFLAEVRKSLTPKDPITTPTLPTDFLTVGVHVRRGGGFDSLQERLRVPLKFPPDSYYIEQIERVSKIFKDRRLYVYILTDDLDPESIVNKYRAALNNSNIHFDYRKTDNGPSQNVLEDFFFMTKFDCLVICQSNFSLMASKLADFALVITPTHPTLINGEVVIDEVKLAFNGKKRVSD
jgi:hypothetical protein